MKKSKIIAAILPICLCIIGCRSIDLPLQEVIEKTNIITFENHGYYNSKDGLTIICEGDSLFLDQEILETDKAIAGDISALRCLHDAIFMGDKNAIDMMVFILNKKNTKTAKNVILRKPKFRGKELFSIMLKLGGEFGCPPNDSEALSINSYWSSKYMDMIHDFNGSPYNTFFRDEVEKRKTFDNYNDDNCGEYLSRAEYQIITEAWDLGLIKLKDFGEE